MLRHLGLIVALAAVSGLVLQTWRASHFKERSAALETVLDGYKEAARIHTKYVKSREAAIRDAAGVERDLMEMEGSDEPLSDYMRDAADRLWSTRP